MRHVACIALMAAGVAGCLESTPTPPLPPVVVDPPAISDHWSMRPGIDGGTASLDPSALGRRTHRMSVSQFDDSFEVLFGTRWGSDLPDGGLFHFTPLLAPVMGEPDYQTELHESLEVTQSFLKFFDNAAANVCERAVLRDLTVPDAGALVVTYQTAADAGLSDVHRAARKNLSRLKYRFHAVWVDPDDAAAWGEWLTLHDALFARAQLPFPTGSGTRALSFDEQRLVVWSALCGELINDPAFVLY